MILVTGATGFLGRFIVDELLTAGHEVRVLVRDAENRSLPWKSMVEVVDGDILDRVALEKALEGVSEVIHAAAVVSFWKKRRAELLEVNVKGTANLIDACIDAEIEKFVQVSSTAAVGRTGTKELITERTKWNNGKGVSWYSRSKYKAELEVNRGIAEGLHAVIVNPALIIGPSDNWEVGSPKIFSIVSKGLRFFNRGVNGVVGAADVARATRMVMEADDLVAGERFLLVAENWSQKDIVNTIAAEFGNKPAKWQLPPMITILAGHVSEWISAITGKEPVITLASMRNSTRQNFFDGSKITRLGFEYEPIKEVLTRTAQAFLAAKRK